MIKMLSKHKFAFLAFSAGLFLGWIVIGWVLWPVHWYNTVPADLGQKYQKAYIKLVAKEYRETRDLVQVRAYLDNWDDLALAQTISAIEANTFDMRERENLDLLKQALSLPYFETSIFSSLMEQKAILFGFAFSGLPLLAALFMFTTPRLKLAMVNNQLKNEEQQQNMSQKMVQKIAEKNESKKRQAFEEIQQEYPDGPVTRAKPQPEVSSRQQQYSELIDENEIMIGGGGTLAEYGLDEYEEEDLPFEEQNAPPPLQHQPPYPYEEEPTQKKEKLSPPPPPQPAGPTPQQLMADMVEKEEKDLSDLNNPDGLQNLLSDVFSEEDDVLDIAALLDGLEEIDVNELNTKAHDLHKQLVEYIKSLPPIAKPELAASL